MPVLFITETLPTQDDPTTQVFASCSLSSRRYRVLVLRRKKLNIQLTTVSISNTRCVLVYDETFRHLFEMRCQMYAYSVDGDCESLTENRLPNDKIDPFSAN